MYCKKILLVVFSILTFINLSSAAERVVSFQVLGKRYELIRETKTWKQAAEIARAKGAHLAKINSVQEQNGVWQKLRALGAMAKSNIATDGGGAYYVWLGGNDIKSEGDWIWDGDDLNGGIKFWNGNGYGRRVGDQYSNWGSSAHGKEPDNYLGNQDGVAIALTNWPLGNAGQWNDVSTTNKFYFLIEYGNDVYEYDFEIPFILKGWKTQQVGGNRPFKWRIKQESDAKFGEFHVECLSPKANDWLITERIKLKKGKYEIMFWVSKAGYKPKLSVGVGTEQNYQRLTVIKEKEITNQSYQLIKCNYISTTEQSVYIGIHTLCARNSAMYVDYFRLRKIENIAPVAHAGINTEVSVGERVELDGSASSDPDGDKITYNWQAPAGIRLTNADKVKASFIAPNVTVNKSYNFTLTVSDGLLSHTKSVQVIVKPSVKRNQSITFTEIQNKTFGDSDFNIQATASSGLPIQFTIQGPATLTGNRVHITGAGNVTITAKQRGNINYKAAANVSQSFTIRKSNQLISLPAITDKTFGDSDFNIRATASSGLPVQFTVEGPATLNGNKIHITGVGNVKVIVKQTGSANYNAALNVTRIFKVLKADQTISFENIPDKTFGDPDFNISATSSSGLPVEFTVEGPATLNGNKIHITGVGNVKVIAKQTGNENYNTANEIVRTFKVKVATDVEILKENMVDMYPNPVKDVLNIRSLVSDNIREILIMNQEGKKVKHKVVCENSTVIDFANFSSGLYFIQIYIGDNMITKRIIRL